MCPLCGRTFFVNTNPFCDECLALADDIRENIADETQIFGKEVDPTVYRPVMGFPGYDVSSTGVVRVRATKIPLKPHRQAKKGVLGPLRVSLWNGETRENVTIAVHRLVAAAFLESYLDGYVVAHIDGNQENLNVNNLKVGRKNAGAVGRKWKHEWTN